MPLADPLAGGPLAGAGVLGAIIGYLLWTGHKERAESRRLLWALSQSISRLATASQMALQGQAVLLEEIGRLDAAEQSRKTAADLSEVSRTIETAANGQPKGDP
jgi:hypothetical protein